MRPLIQYLIGLLAGAALFVASSMARFILQARRITDVWSVGFPFRFYEAWGPCPTPGTCQATFPILFCIDLALWLGLGLAAAGLIQRLLKQIGER